MIKILNKYIYFCILSLIKSSILSSCDNSDFFRDSNLDTTQSDKPSTKDKKSKIDVQSYKGVQKTSININQRTITREDSTIIEHKGDTRALPIKILWLIDDSGSMKNDVPRLQAGIIGFVDTLTRDHNIDMTVTFISCNQAIKITCIKLSTISHSSIRMVNQYIDSTDDLQVTQYVLSKELIGYFDSNTTNVIPDFDISDVILPKNVYSI
ncbi:MAG: hypothetical protein OXC44_05050 [Proteobacteria bacterium]|nr:hypothetical protein [Pseudomonadota bacterium]